jgi:hypothetical protein
MSLISKSQSTKIADILSELNKGGSSAWEEMPGYYSLQACTLDIKQKPNPVSLSPAGVVVKGFINTETGEMKFYLAKILDIPDQEKEALW